MKMHFKPLGILYDHPVTNTSDAGFLLLIQQAALLGLKDAGYLNEMQYRQTEDALRRQYRQNLKLTGTEENAND